MSNPSSDIVIAAAVRTPVGSFNGALSSVPAHELGAIAISAALKAAGVEAADVDEVILGQVLQAGAGQGPARQAAVKAGVPVESPAWSLNQLCGSGLRAVALGYQQIAQGDARDRGLRRPGKHEPGAPRPEPPRRAEDGRPRPGGHHDQGWPLGRLPRLSHGPDGGEHRQPLADHPRGPGQVRRRLPEQGRGRPEGRQVRRPDRAGHHQGPQGRYGGGQGRIHPRRRHLRGDERPEAPPSTRKGRSPPPTPRA